MLSANEKYVKTMGRVYTMTKGRAYLDELYASDPEIAGRLTTRQDNQDSQKNLMVLKDK